MYIPFVSQQSELFGYKGPQLPTPHLSFPMQWLSLSQSPSFILQGLVFEQHVQKFTHAENELHGGLSNMLFFGAYFQETMYIKLAMYAVNYEKRAWFHRIIHQKTASLTVQSVDEWRSDTKYMYCKIANMAR